MDYYFPKRAYKFKSSNLETIYRQERLSRDINVATPLLLIAALFHLASIPMDISLLGEQRSLYLVVCIRFLSAIIALLALYLIRRKQEVNFFDAVIFIWAALLLVGIFLSNLFYPASYIVHIGWDVLLTLAVYSVVPLPLLRQMVAALLFSLCTIIHFYLFHFVIYSSAIIDVILMFLCANTIGIFASWEMNNWKRSKFLALKREAEIKDDLEKTLHELNTLKGIIPICSYCKNIRTDKGDWEKVEAYVRKHSDAKFSHGICPECEKELSDTIDELDDDNSS